MILKPYDKLVNHGIKNFTDYKNNIDTGHMEDDHVSSLFKNVPINRRHWMSFMIV